MGMPGYVPSKANINSSFQRVGEDAHGQNVKRCFFFQFYRNNVRMCLGFRTILILIEFFFLLIFLICCRDFFPVFFFLNDFPVFCTLNAKRS